MKKCHFKSIFITWELNNTPFLLSNRKKSVIFVLKTEK